MAKHILTPEQRLKEIRIAIRALGKKCGRPKWLVPGMKKHATKLVVELKEEG